MTAATSTEALEAAARAAYEAASGSEPETSFWPQLIEGERDEWRRAVLAALSIVLPGERDAATLAVIEAARDVTEFNHIPEFLDVLRDALAALPSPPQECDHNWIGGNDGLWCTKCKQEYVATPQEGA